MQKQTIAILGAGSWGSAIAIHLAKSGHHVLLWGRNPQHIAEMITARANQNYLPDISFPSNIEPTTDLNLSIKQADKIIIAVPSHAFSNLLEQINCQIHSLAWLTKGVDPKTHKLLSDLVKERFGENLPIGVIAGPSFAREVALSLPTALTIASNEKKYQSQLQQLLHQNNLRVYRSFDITGVQICGAIKNILAIACGISDGLGYGANAKAALITRGLAEMTRLGLALGAKPETFTGLAGVGDLVLTCTDNQSRNRRFGLQLGKGVDIVEAERHIQQVVEGKYNAAQICSMAKKNQVEMPICEQVNHLLLGKITAKEAVTALMNRPAKME
ncbi:NAD(P)-dependent glycerol-3-phosphate dehydrogenase [Legionella israelensis]|uniref:NAD(P)H-dependent glycerol-3-phosphate dehydrogenase n=1 Tax=Legionella israelensis TaxID=454 RepID=UPI0011806621|nr:NAD(P)H-dependent glycerol-3-phosphate dehydrogenase [Legionella israelensis]QDP73406.1 NAD(P)-dependent glycerol-3-phosphate dehydrogenase [Legionella israelensis]